MATTDNTKQKSGKQVQNAAASQQRKRPDTKPQAAKNDNGVCALPGDMESSNKGKGPAGENL